MTCPSIDDLEDEVCHHVPLKIRKAVFVRVTIRHRVLHLNVEANVGREGAEHLQHTVERVGLGVVGVGSNPTCSSVGNVLLSGPSSSTLSLPDTVRELRWGHRGRLPVSSELA